MAYHTQIIDNLTFREWLDTVSVDATQNPLRHCVHNRIELTCTECRKFLTTIQSEKSLDERLADKEKRIKRRIQSRLRYQQKKVTRNQLDKGTIGDIIAAKLKEPKRRDTGS